MTVICRKCKTSHPDDTDTCDCGADLRGRDGLRPAGGAKRRTADPTASGRPGSPPGGAAGRVDPRPRDPAPRPAPISPDPSSPSATPPPAVGQPPVRGPSPSTDSDASESGRAGGLIGAPPGTGARDEFSPTTRSPAPDPPVVDAPDEPPSRQATDPAPNPTPAEAASPAPVRPAEPKRPQGRRVVGRRPGDEVDDADVEPTTNHRNRKPPSPESAGPGEPSLSPSNADGGSHPGAGTNTEPERNDPDVSSGPSTGGGIAGGGLIETPIDRESSGAAPSRPQPVGEGQIACGSCHRANSDELRFCRTCGAQLPEKWNDDDDLDDEEQRDSLWRRMLGTTRTEGRDARTTAQRMRDSGQSKIKYKAKYTLQSKLRALGFVAGGAGALLLVLGPVRGRIDRWLNPPDGVAISALQIELPPTEPGEPSDTTEADPAGDAAEEPVDTDADAAEGEDGADFLSSTPQNAHDDDPETAFIIDWSGEPVDFTIVVPDTTDVSELIFETGLPNEEDRSSLYRRPSEMELSVDGETQEFTLKDQEGPQRVKVDLPRSSEIEVRILETHDRTWQTYDRLAIAEIRFVD